MLKVLFKKIDFFSIKPDLSNIFFCIKSYEKSLYLFLDFMYFPFICYYLEPSWATYFSFAFLSLCEETACVVNVSVLAC